MMRQKVSSYEEKKRFILYKGHTGWKIKTRIFGSLLVTFSAFAFAGNSNIISVHAATDTAQQEENSTSASKSVQPVTPQVTSGIQKAVPELSTNSKNQDSETSNETPTTAKQEPVAESTASSTNDESKVSPQSEQTENSTEDAALEEVPKQTETPEVRSELMKSEATQVTAQATDPTDKYPVLSPGEDVNIGADTTEVDLGAKDIAGHFTATVENRGGSDQDDDPADNIQKVPIGVDGTVALTSNDPHEYYTSSGNSTPMTGHQAAHVSFEHEIDFSHGFSMSGALGIGSKTSGGADSVGFIFAPGDPSKATQGGSGGMLGLQGLDNAFGFVFDEYDNMSAYNDPGTSTGGWFPTNSFSPYVGWRTTGADGKLQKVSSDAEWKKTSELTLNRSQGNTLNDFTMDYSADTKTLTVKLGGQTFTRSISDVSSGYSISVSASTGGSWNDYSAKIDKFSYTPKTISLGVKLVDSAEQDALLNNVNVKAIANIGDTVSVFSTQEAADRAVKEDKLDPSLVAVIPTDSAGNVYVIDGSKTIAGETGTVNHIGGDATVGDGTYYSYTVKDGDGQGMTIPVRLAYKAVVTPVDSKTGDPIEGLEPTTVIAVKGQPSVVEIPGYTTTKVTLDPPAAGEKDAQDKLVIDQGTTGTDTTTTNDQSNPIGHYYNGDSKTVDGHEVVTNATVGTGQSVADNLNKQPLNDKDGKPVVSGQKDDQGTGLKTITSDDYYWSNVGNATATDSTDEATPKASGSILVPTASTLDYWKGVAAANQTKADTYKQQSQDMHDKFVGITGLNQKQKDDADSLLQSVVDIYAKVSQKNSDAKDAFEKAEAAADATSIYGSGQTGYASLEEVQNLLISFKTDLDGLTTKNDDVKSSLATFQSPSKHYTYGDEVKFPEISLGDGFGTVTDDKIKGFENPDYYKYYSANNPDDTTPIQTPVNAGSYVLKLTDAGRTYLKSLAPDDPQAGLYVSAIVTIDPKEIAAGIGDATVTYGGNDNGQFPTFSGNIGSDVETDPSNFEVTDASNSKVSVSQLQAGKTYTISYTKDAQAKLNTDPNYTIQSFGTGTLTVNKRAITVKAQDHNKTYGDSTNPTLDLTSGSANGLVNGDKIDSLNVKLTRQAGEAAGTYDITGQSNSSNYDVTINKGIFTIAQKPITVTVGSSTITYGDSTPESKFTIDDGYSLVGNDGISDLGVTVTNPTDVKNVGTYHIIGNAKNDGNYFVTVNNGILTVSPKIVTVTAANKSKIYGDKDPELTLQDPSDVLVSGDDVSDLNVTLTRKEGENVGEYDINGTPTDSTKVGNYNVTVKPGKFNITQKAVTVTAANSSKVYGDKDPELTLQDPSDVLVSGDSISDLKVKLTRDPGENVESYAISEITPTDPSESGNYKVTVLPGKFNITNRAITVTIDSSKITYGDTIPIPTFKITAGSLVGKDEDSALGVMLTNPTDVKNVGTYYITGGVANNGNYAVTVNKGTLTIVPKTANPTVETNSITYGDTSLPKIGGSMDNASKDHNLEQSDFEVVDDSGNIQKPEQLQVGGTYWIQYTDVAKATLTADKNYSFDSFGRAKLSVNAEKANPTVETNTVTYGDTSLPTIIGNLGNASKDHNLEQSDFEVVDDSGNIQKPEQLQVGGTYWIQYTDAAKAALTADKNYDFDSFGRAALTVKAEEANPTVETNTVTYGDTSLPKIAGNLDKASKNHNLDQSDFEVVDDSGNILKPEQLQVGGTYWIQYTDKAKTDLKADKNYNFDSFGRAKLSVNAEKADPTVKENSVTYGDTVLPEIDGNLDTASKDHSLNQTDFEVVDDSGNILKPEQLQVGGTYWIQYTDEAKANLTADKNYSFDSFGRAKLSVNAEKANPTVETNSVTYGDTSLPKIIGSLDKAFKDHELNQSDFEVVDDSGNILKPEQLQVGGTYWIQYTDKAKTDLMADKNYNFDSFGRAKLSVNAEKVNPTVETNTVTYGDTSLPTIIGSLNNASKDHNLDQSDFEVVDDSGTVMKPEQLQAGGTYWIQYTAKAKAILTADKNYNFESFGKAPLEVNKAVATTTPTEPTKPAELTYGDTPKITRIAKIGSKSITLNPDDFKIVNKNKDAVASNQLKVNVPYTIELTDTAINNLQADNPNYDFSKLSFGQLSIKPLNITVSINNQTMYAGGDEPQNSAKLEEGSELKDGDKLNITYEDPDSSDVGTYNINANMDKLKVDNPNYAITVVPGALKVLGKDVDADGNVTITEKDAGGNVVKVTKQWNDGSDTIYTNNPADNTKGADEVDKDGKTSSTQTIDPHSAKTVLPNSDGSATVVTIDDSGQPVFTHYGVDPDHDGVTSADELKNGTDPLVYNSRGGSSSVMENGTIVKKNQNIATTTNLVNLYNNEGNLLESRVLGIDTAWYSDEEYTISGVMYYRVATDEFAKASDVYVYIDAQPMLIRVYNNVRGELVDYQGTKLSRELSSSSQWHADRIAVINGQHYYRVATNEFVPVEQAYPYSVVDAEVTTNFETPIYNERGEKLEIALLANGTYKVDKVVTMNGVNYYRVATNQFIPVAAVRDYANVNFNMTTNVITPIYNEHGQFLNIELPAKAIYKVDRVIYVNGVHYYRVATNMFVKANRF